MAIAITEVWQNMIDRWEALLRDELTPIPIYQSDEWESHGTEALRLSDGESTQEDQQALGETRFYTAVLTYYLSIKPGRTRQKELRKAFNRINAVVNQNRASLTNEKYLYHDWQVVSSVINDEPQEDEPDLQQTGNVRMVLQATITEAIS